MAHVGETLFARNDYHSDGESDIWDDTALIQAYDNAVSIMKSQLPESSAFPDDSRNSYKTSKSSKKKKKKKGKNKAKTYDSEADSTKWKIGDHCRAVYTEDGEIYESIIVSINNADNNCVVRFLGYGNEEEQNIMDLLPSDVIKREQKHSMSESYSGSETGMDWQQGHRRNSSGSSRGRGRGRMPSPPFSMHFPPGRPAFVPPAPFLPQQTQWPGMSLPFTPFQAVPMMAPMFQGNPLLGGPGLQGSQPLPRMPPPPPPPVGVEDIGDDKDALNSMLMSWYMSGYHTGYYQGLKEGKKTQSQTSTVKEKSEEGTEKS